MGSVSVFAVDKKCHLLLFYQVPILGFCIRQLSGFGDLRQLVCSTCWDIICAAMEEAAFYGFIIMSGNYRTPRVDYHQNNFMLNYI